MGKQTDDYGQTRIQYIASQRRDWISGQEKRPTTMQRLRWSEDWFKSVHAKEAMRICQDCVSLEIIDKKEFERTYHRFGFTCPTCKSHNPIPFRIYGMDAEVFFEQFKKGGLVCEFCGKF